MQDKKFCCFNIRTISSLLLLLLLAKNNDQWKSRHRQKLKSAAVASQKDCCRSKGCLKRGLPGAPQPGGRGLATQDCQQWLQQQLLQDAGCTLIQQHRYDRIKDCCSSKACLLGERGLPGTPQLGERGLAVELQQNRIAAAAIVRMHLASQVPRSNLV